MDITDDTNTNSQNKLTIQVEPENSSLENNERDHHS